MGIPLLNDILIIFGLSIAVLYICNRLRVPAIVGFLLTGIMVGPHGLGLIGAVHEVEILAEIGVVLLLFTIGLEFSLKGLLQIKKSVLLGGSLQVLLTILAAFIIAKQIGMNDKESIFIGFLISLSSTAIVLRVLQEKAEIDSPHGRTSLAILIFQDLIIIPMMLFIPILAGKAGNSSENILILLAKGAGLILFVILSAKWLVHQVLYQIARTRSRELFLLSIVVICFAVAWLTSSMGLSLALGAFLAGLIISESEYSHQTLGNILPFRDIFTSFFFVSIGMLLDIEFFLQRSGLIVLIALIVLVLKTITALFTTAFLGLPLRTMILVGLALCQIGEFSFILSKGGVEYGLLARDNYQIFLAVSVLTMAATPFLIAMASRGADIVLGLPLPERLKSGFGKDSSYEKAHLKDHLIVIGFGVNGRNLTRAARSAGIPYVIIEMNPETVRNEKAKGEPIYFGDAIQEAVLEHADIVDARIVVVAINDPTATRKITEIARRLNPKVYIIVRTRYLQEMKPLYELGANEVIPEEFETAVEIFTRVLRKYLIPREEIEKFIAEVRSDGYEMFRSLSKDFTYLSDLNLQIPDVEIATFRVSEQSPISGKSLAQIGLRKEYGVTLLAIRRDSQILSNPGGDTILCARDVLIILGKPDRIPRITSLFQGSEKENS